MANLLPSRERESLVRERFRHLISAVLVLISGVFALGTILLVPSFIAAVSSRSTLSERLETTRQLLDRQKDASAQNDVASTKEKIKLVVDEEDALSVSELLARIVAITPAQVSLRDILWRSDGEGVFLDLAGSAATRSTLLAFGDALRSSGLFADVSIPIESLAAQTDLEFRLSLTLTP